MPASGHTKYKSNDLMASLDRMFLGFRIINILGPADQEGGKASGKECIRRVRKYKKVEKMIENKMVDVEFLEGRQVDAVPSHQSQSAS